VTREVTRPFVLEPGQTRIERAMLPFKLVAADSGGALSICEFRLPGWASGPVLHRHDAVDEAFFVVTGDLEIQIDDSRFQAASGSFVWVPRGSAHTFACAGPDEVHVLALATPGGIEDLFAEQFEYLTSSGGTPDPAVLSEMGVRHGAQTVGPPITATNAPPA
jgi:quercetin dioxygenase-like cupin family protein